MSIEAIKGVGQENKSFGVLKSDQNDEAKVNAFHNYHVPQLSPGTSIIAFANTNADQTGVTGAQSTHII